MSPLSYAQSLSAEDFAHNMRVVRERVADAGGDADAVTIVAVSKGQPLTSIRAALDVGQRQFGENYADELVEKADALSSGVAGADAATVWHFQGRLQTNKINRLKSVVSVWQTVDSVDRAAALGKRVPGAAVLVQINSGGGDRSGALIGEVASIVAHARDCGLAVLGLMTVAPLLDGVPDKSAAQQAFRSLSRLADELSLPERSMGMSHDLAEAVAAGATMLRVGAALFGPRS